MRRFIGHIPMVGLAVGTEELPLRRGSLRKIPFEEWQGYDSSYPNRQWSYEKTAPVFLVLDLPGPENSTVDHLIQAFESGLDEGSQELRQMYLSLLLRTGARLASPHVSVSYLVIHDDVRPSERGDGRSQLRSRAGICGRELIVFGEQILGVALKSTGAVEDFSELTDWLTGYYAPVEGLLDALVRTAQPGYSNQNESLHLISGLESLLVRRGEPLTETFARRYSVLAANDDARASKELGRQLYAFRSDLIHGREVDKSDAVERDRFLAEDHRDLTCRIAERSIRWFVGTGLPIDVFHKRLDDAFRDEGAFAALCQDWMPSNEY